MLSARASRHLVVRYGSPEGSLVQALGRAGALERVD